jgi:hypothetical protein
MRALRFCGVDDSRVLDWRPKDSGVVAAME